MRALFYSAVALGAAVLFVILPLLILLMHAVHAGTLEVRPTLLVIDPSEHIAVLSLENREDRDAVYQISLFRWRQDGDEQTLDPTDELIASPPIVTIAAHASQTIRVGLRAHDLPTEEKTYRLIVEEVPSSTAPRAQGLNINLRLSLPLFVRPVEDMPAPQLSGALFLEGSTATFTVRNGGHYTVRIVRASIKQPGVEQDDRLELNRLTYIQPGQSADFVFTIPGMPRGFDRAALTLQTDQGDVDINAVLAKAPSDAPAPAVH